jgi:hypothetical protein
MGHKALKSDMTYALKKMTKEGKTITFESFANNLELVDGALVLSGDKVDVLEAFVLVKGFQCSKEQAAYSVPLTDMISEQGQIAKTDFYDFLDGLENVAGSDKSEFYKVGVYIREKFTPVGTRSETLQKVKYQDAVKVETVRRFVVYNRPAPGCKKTGAPTIVEVEYEVFIPLLAKDGEFAARILKPEWLWEPTRVLQDGVLVDVVMPQVYASHAVYETLELAEVAAFRQIRGGLDFEVRKGKIPSYTEEDFKTRCDLIQRICLS